MSAAELLAAKLQWLDRHPRGRPHRLSYYGHPDTADRLIPIITLAGGTALDVLDDWQTGIRYWATIEFGGTVAVFCRVMEIAGVVGCNFDVRFGTPDPDPPAPPPIREGWEQRDGGQLWRDVLGQQEAALDTVTGPPPRLP